MHVFISFTSVASHVYICSMLRDYKDGLRKAILRNSYVVRMSFARLTHYIIVYTWSMLHVYIIIENQLQSEVLNKQTPEKATFCKQNIWQLSYNMPNHAYGFIIQQLGQAYTCTCICGLHGHTMVVSFFVRAHPGESNLPSNGVRSDTLG